MSSDDDLTRAIRGGVSGEQSPADARLADALRALRAHGRSTQPRANATLAAFLSQACSPAAARPTTTPGSHPRRDLVSSSIRRPLRRLAGLGLVAKVVLGASLALGGATAVAATTGPPEGNDSVVTTPVSSDSSIPAQTSDDSDDGTADQGHGQARPTHSATSPATVTSPAAVQHQRRHDDGADRSGQSGHDQGSADERDDSGRHDGRDDTADTANTAADSHDGGGDDSGAAPGADSGYDGGDDDGTADQGGSNPDD